MVHSRPFYCGRERVIQEQREHYENIIVVFVRIVTLEKTIEDHKAEILAVRSTTSASTSKDERYM